jgi:hypothetical protein
MLNKFFFVQIFLYIIFYNSIINNSYYEVNIFENIPLKRIFVDINNNIYFTN